MNYVTSMATAIERARVSCYDNAISQVLYRSFSEVVFRHTAALSLSLSIYKPDIDTSCQARHVNTMLYPVQIVKLTNDVLNCRGSSYRHRLREYPALVGFQVSLLYVRPSYFTRVAAVSSQ